MTEKEALEQFGAADWRSLNKKQIMSFIFKTAPELSDDVRLRILESAPNILRTAQDMLAEYQNTATKALDKNHEVAKAYLTCCHEAEDTLRLLMSNESATFEEKKYWSNQIFTLLHEMREFDKGNKSFLIKVLSYAGGAVLLVGTITIAAVTGGKIELPFKK
jgi:hypothetical protein